MADGLKMYSKNGSFDAVIRGEVYRGAQGISAAATSAVVQALNAILTETVERDEDGNATFQDVVLREALKDFGKGLGKEFQPIYRGAIASIIKGNSRTPGRALGAVDRAVYGRNAFGYGRDSETGALNAYDSAMALYERTFNLDDNYATWMHRRWLRNPKTPKKNPQFFASHRAYAETLGRPMPAGYGHVAREDRFMAETGYTADMIAKAIETKVEVTTAKGAAQGRAGRHTVNLRRSATQFRNLGVKDLNSKKNMATARNTLLPFARVVGSYTMKVPAGADINRALRIFYAKREGFPYYNQNLAVAALEAAIYRNLSKNEEWKLQNG